MKAKSKYCILHVPTGIILEGDKQYTDIAITNLQKIEKNKANILWHFPLRFLKETIDMNDIKIGTKEYQNKLLFTNKITANDVCRGLSKKIILLYWHSRHCKKYFNRNEFEVIEI